MTKPVIIVFIFIFIAAALLRSIPLMALSHTSYGTQKKIFLSGDGGEYSKFTYYLLKYGITGLFDQSAGYRQGLRSVTAFISPAYPFFVWVIFKLYGVNYLALTITQIIVDLGTLGLIFLISCKIIKSKAFCLIPCAVYAFNSQAILFASAFMAYTLFTFVLTLLVYLLISALHDYRLWKMMLAGFLTALAALLKPWAIYMIPVLAFVYILCQGKKGFDSVQGFRQTFLAVAAFLVFAMMTLLPWQLRNQYIYGEFAISTQPAVDTLTAHAAYVKYLVDHPYYQGDPRLEDPKFFTLENRLKKQIKVTNPFERASIFRQVGLNYIRRYPYEYLFLHLQGIRNLIFSPSFFVSLSNRKVIKKIFTLWQIDAYKLGIINSLLWLLLMLQYGLIIAGVVISVSKNYNFYTLVLFLLVFLYCLSIGPLGYQRYLYPISPLLAVLVGMGAFQLYGIFPRFREKVRN